MPRPRKRENKTFDTLTEAELQALDGERRHAIELERAKIVEEAQSAAAQAKAARESSS